MPVVEGSSSTVTGVHVMVRITGQGVRVQECSNNPGGYSCACHRGFVINSDGVHVMVRMITTQGDTHVPVIGVHHQQ